MSIKEIDEETHREVQHAAARCRPDGATHRHDVLLDESARVALALQVVAESFGVSVIAQQGPTVTIEAQNVGDHLQEFRIDDIPSLREQRVDRGAVVFESAALTTQ